MTREINFDGLIGPTHNYAGLSFGNIASATHAGAVSRPREAALQGLRKARLLMSMGIGQGFLLPHLRPHLPTLHALGFRGSPETMIADAWRADPAVLRMACSASAMWTANAATVSPSADTQDGRLHLTVANLAAMPHRALEHGFTHRLLSRMFADPLYFAVHPALPGGVHFGDEGAANHGRLAATHGAAGVELFVYGNTAQGRFPARQTQRASEAVARLHGVQQAVFAQQSDAAIQAGAFHNDVVSVTNGTLLFAHEDAFADRDALLAALAARVPGFQLLEVPRTAVSLEDAIRTYLFNAQLVTRDDGGMTLIVPQECTDTLSTRRYLERLPELQSPIRDVQVIDVRESMHNGGGPACLRLRVVMTGAQAAAMDQRFLLTDDRTTLLEDWIRRTYPESIAPDDLGDVALHRQCLSALDELTRLLTLGDLYAFQSDAS